MKPVFIYVLNDPITGIVRYCGQTLNPDTRLNEHLSISKRKKWHCACWIKSLTSKNLRPIMEILDVVPDTEADFWEREYIQNFRERGFDLTNITPGGNTGPSRLGHKHSPEARRKIGAGWRGKKRPPFSAEWREKISLAKKGSVPGNKGKKASPETCEKMSLAHKGEKKSLEYKKNMSNVITLWWAKRKGTTCPKV